MLDINRYKKINQPDLVYNSVKIKTHIPTPAELDYKRGYITRYFVQKANDSESEIYEVDYIGFSKVIDNPFYSNVSINWRLIGTDEQIKDSNFKAIRLVTPTIKKIQLYLPNLLQFKQKKDLELL
jgi:hypothetical protein